LDESRGLGSCTEGSGRPTSLGSGFRAQYLGALWEGVCEVDEMAQRDGPSGDSRLVLVQEWLTQQAILRELVKNKKSNVKCSVNLPEFIELIDALGNVDKMYRLLNNRKETPIISPKKHLQALPSPPKLYPSSSSEFPTQKDKGKGKARDIFISQSKRNELQ
jgi:hypothetical protein